MILHVDSFRFRPKNMTVKEPKMLRRIWLLYLSLVALILVTKKLDLDGMELRTLCSTWLVNKL